MIEAWKVRFSQEKIDEIFESVECLIEMWLDEYKKIRSENYVKNLLLDFYKIPKWELHKKFKDFVQPILDEIQLKRENELTLEITNNIRRFREYWDYEILDKSWYYSNDWKVVKTITIWIPYYNAERRITRFAWTVIVDSSKNPKVYEYVSTFRTYVHD